MMREIGVREKIAGQKATPDSKAPVKPGRKPSRPSSPHFRPCITVRFNKQIRRNVRAWRIILMIHTVPEVQRNRKSEYKISPKEETNSKKLNTLSNWSSSSSSSSSTMFSRLFQKSSPQQSPQVRVQFFHN